MLKKLKISNHGLARIFQEEDVLNAIYLSNGTMISIANILKCDAHLTKKNIRYYNSCIIAFEERKSKIVEIAEYQMMKNIKNGDSQMIRFALERLDPDNYGNKGITIEGSGNNIQINIQLPDGEKEDISEIGRIGSH